MIDDDINTNIISFYLFKTINILHRFRDGNGRTARFIYYLFLLDKVFSKQAVVELLGVEDGKQKTEHQISSREIMEDVMKVMQNMVIEKYLKSRDCYIRYNSGVIVLVSENIEQSFRAVAVIRTYQEYFSEIVIDWDNFKDDQNVLSNLDIIKKEIISNTLL